MKLALCTLTLVVLSAPAWAQSRPDLSRSGKEPGPDLVKIVWVRLKGGSFEMGSNEGDADEKPVHTVRLSSFDMARTEVANAQYAAFMAAHGNRCGGIECVKGSRYSEPGKGRHPVAYVTWEGARAFCTWAGGRLPSEAEWEYAARSGGRSRTYPWGNEKPDCGRAVMGGCSGSTRPVCSKPRGNTAQGLCDMAGNVWEWVSDWYGSDYYKSSPAKNPKGPGSGSLRVHRGGSFDIGASYLRAVSRAGYPPGVSDYYLGFRCARSAR